MLVFVIGSNFRAILATVTYLQACEYLRSLSGRGWRLGLDRISALLDLLENPHLAGPRFLHVAGTNGKGSTCAFIESVLRKAGFRTGAFYSPYVFDIRERVQIGGRPIDEQTFAAVVAQVKTAADSSKMEAFGGITEFEAKTAAGFLAWKQSGCEYVALETGLGGRLDSTNVVDPLVSVITEIDWDHQNHLGDTLAKIAFEKSGIIKPGRPVITGVTDAEPLEVIKNSARERRCVLWRVGEEICVERACASALVRTPKRKIVIEPSLLGRFQFKNAAMALAAIDAAEIPVADSDVQEGIKKAWLPGRLQIVHENPKVVLDGAHNPQSARETAAALGTYRLVYSCTRGHDPAAVLNEFRAGAIAVYLCQMSSDRGMPLSEIEAAAGASGMKFEAHPSVESALHRALEQSRPGDTVLVSGSFYHLGEARRAVCGT